MSLAPADIEFRPVSHSLAALRLINVVIFMLLLLGASAVAALAISPLIWAVFGLFVLVTCWLLWLVPRQVKNMGYALTDTELIYKRGAMWRTVTVVPYGRMQYVDLSQGPLMRMFGISDLRLHTASASTISNIQGLPTSEAEALREHLSRLGSSQMAGL